jgi:mannose-6-phosphate isomerase-like protein (cupin superfamily)
MTAPVSFVTNSAALPVETFDWGTLQWLCNDRLLPGSVQTLGLCQIHPGAANPRHYHPNCDEVLYMISGRGRHSFGDESMELTAGMTIRIPSGVVHNMANTGTEPIVCLIAFNAGDRQTVFLS